MQRSSFRSEDRTMLLHLSSPVSPLLGGQERPTRRQTHGGRHVAAWFPGLFCYPVWVCYVPPLDFNTRLFFFTVPATSTFYSIRRHSKRRVLYLLSPVSEEAWSLTQKKNWFMQWNLLTRVMILNWVFPWASYISHKTWKFMFSLTSYLLRFIWDVENMTCNLVLCESLNQPIGFL